MGGDDQKNASNGQRYTCDNPPRLGKLQARKNLRSDEPDASNANKEESNFRQCLRAVAGQASIFRS
jgi:hypothetical protein